MNFDERVQMKFVEAFGEFVDAARPIVLFRAGYHFGLTDGVTIKAQVEFDRNTLQQQADRDIGHNQGLAHAAFVASHCVLPVNASEGQIRDLIVMAIESANVVDAPKANGGIGIG